MDARYYYHPSPIFIKTGEERCCEFLRPSFCGMHCYIRFKSGGNVRCVSLISETLSRRIAVTRLSIGSKITLSWSS